METLCHFNGGADMELRLSANENEGHPDRHVLSARGALDIELAPQVSLIGGIGLGYRIDYGTSFSGGRLFPLVFAGIKIFLI